MEHNKEQHKKSEKPYVHHEHHKEHDERKKEVSKSFYTKVIVLLGIVLVLFALYNIFQISSFNNLFDQRIAEAKEAARPAEIELEVITTNDCEDCYDINAVVGVIESTGVNITKKTTIDFSEAASLINKYDIEKVPTVIVTGELNRSKSLTFKLKDISEERQNAYIFTGLQPPFVETSTGDTKGRISLIHLKNNDCTDCYNLTPFIEQLSESGLKFKEQGEIDVASDIGAGLVKRYEIEKVPTIIIDQELEVYSDILETWNLLGTKEDDGNFVMREISPPYYSIEDKKVKGLISMTILKDKFCQDCYDPNIFHKPILLRMGVVLSQEDTIDIADDLAKDIIKKYKIEKIPTILLKGDVEEYPVLVKAWTDVGSVESDGTYIFRKVEVAQQTYRDLTSDKIIDPQIPS